PYTTLFRSRTGIEIIGMISTTLASEIYGKSIITGAVDPSFIADFARAHEEGGFDRVLVGYGSTGADGFVVAAHAAAATTHLGFLIAHRPGFVAPTLAARKAASLDHVTGGRIALHIITGGSDVYALWGEPVAAIRRSIAEVSAAAPPGRAPRFSVSVRPILGATEEKAWARARSILERIVEVRRGAATPARPQSVGSQRLLDLAAHGEV